MTDSDPRISVALVTRNRPESLRRTLESVRAQNCQPMEVVVSDDSDDQYASGVHQLAREFDCRYVRGPREGLYANRNRAALACRGTHVRTMDDDHEFPEGHFAAVREHVERDPESIWIIGEHYPGKGDHSRFPGCPAQLHPRGFSVTPEDPQNCWALADGATIFPRSVFDEGHWYADRFKFGAAYLEFGSRLHWLGYRIRCMQTTHVVHHYDESARAFMDPYINLSSRCFAMLCHSFIYQPSLRNRLLTVLELGNIVRKHGTLGLRTLRAGFLAYRAHADTTLRNEGASRRTLSTLDVQPNR